MKYPFKNSKVGDKVYSIAFGAGRVIERFGETLVVNFHFGNPYVDDPFNELKVYSLKGKCLSMSNDVPLKRDLFKYKPIVTSKQRLDHHFSKAFGTGVQYSELLERWFLESYSKEAVIAKSLINRLNKILKKHGYKVIKESNSCTEFIQNATDCTVSFPNHAKGMPTDYPSGD